jgi:hypothetical protein
MRRWELWVTIALFSSATAIAAFTVADPDLWGHLRFGLDILSSGQLSETDPYSYATLGQRWINHEWLVEVLLALAWSASGATGLIALKMLAALGLLGLLYRNLTSQGVPRVAAAVFLLPLCLPLYFAYFAHLRPQIFTFLCFGVLLTLLRAAEGGRYGILWLLAPLMALWANLHGGVLAGIGVMGLWSLGQLFENWRARWRFALPVGVACLCVLANPYGLDLLFFLLRTATVPREEIRDWQPLTLFSLFGIEYAIVLACLVTAIALSAAPKKRLPLALCALMAALPWLALRHLPLFSIAAVILGREHFAALARRLETNPRSAVAPPPWASAIPAVAAAAVLAFAASAGWLTRIHVNPALLPVAAVELLKHSRVDGNMAIDFGWGEYAIWHLGPRIKVGIDGRRETIYPEGWYRRYVDFRVGRNDWAAGLQGAQMALVGRNAAADNLLMLSPGWQRVFADEVSALFIRRDAPQRAAVERALATFKPPEKTSFP